MIVSGDTRGGTHHAGAAERAELGHVALESFVAAETHLGG